MPVAQGWGMRRELNGARVSVLQDEKVLEIIAQPREYTLLNCALKNDQDGKFYAMFLPQYLKKEIGRCLLAVSLEMANTQSDTHI